MSLLTLYQNMIEALHAQIETLIESQGVSPALSATVS
jgi:hypothetical protein